MYTLSSTLTLLHQLIRLAGMVILVACGEFCIFDSFHCVLTISISFSVVFVSFPMMCTSVPMFNISVQFPMAFGRHCLAASIGGFLFSFGVF